MQLTKHLSKNMRSLEFIDQITLEDTKKLFDPNDSLEEIAAKPEYIEFIKHTIKFYKSLEKDLKEIKSISDSDEEVDSDQYTRTSQRDLLLLQIPSCNSEKKIALLEYIQVSSRISNKSRQHFITRVSIAIKLYNKMLNGLESQSHLIEQGKNRVPIANHVMKSMTKMLKGHIGDIKDKRDKAVFKQKLENTINKNINIPEKEKAYELKKIQKESNDYEISQYLGYQFTKQEVLFIRSILSIVGNMYNKSEIENTDGMIYIPWTRIYEENGISKQNGKYPTKLIKIVKSIVIEENSNLKKHRWVKDENSGRVFQTPFILEIEYSKKVLGIKLPTFLFINKAKLKNYTLMDNQGYIRFKKNNKTDLGFQIFIYLERLMSQQNSFKLIDLDTILNVLVLDDMLKQNKSRVLNYIERAFEEMVSCKTILKSWSKQKGKRGQIQYNLTPIYHKEPNKVVESDEQIIHKTANIIAKKVSNKIKKKVTN